MKKIEIETFIVKICLAQLVVPRIRNNALN